MPNFSSLAGLEGAEKFLWGVGGVGWFAQSFSCQTQPLCCVVLCWGWGFDKNKKNQAQMTKRDMSSKISGGTESVN